MSATDTIENELIDHILGTGAYTAPSNVYVKLHLGDPGEAGTANPAAETTRTVATFSAASGGSADLSATVSWTSVSNSETYSHWSLWDASTAGTALLYGALDSTVAVTAGDNFDLTALVINLD